MNGGIARRLLWKALASLLARVGRARDRLRDTHQSELCGLTSAPFAPVPLPNPGKPRSALAPFPAEPRHQLLTGSDANYGAIA